MPQVPSSLGFIRIINLSELLNKEEESEFDVSWKERAMMIKPVNDDDDLISI